MTSPLPNTTGELALQVLRQHAAAFAEHAPQVTSDADPEHVHQARVATRRMRAALRLFKDVLQQELSSLNDELAWIAAQLGSVRDLDVQVRRLQARAEELGLSQQLVPYGAWLEEQRARAVTALEDALRSQRFVQLGERLQQLDDAVPDVQTDTPLTEDAPERLENAVRKLRKVARALDADSEPTAFHKARIRTKRLRYTTEFLAPIYGKPAQRLVEQTVALQDLLGDHQDGVVSIQRIQESVQTAAGAWPAETSLALGRLVQCEIQRGIELRSRFRATYQEVRDAWRRLRRAL
jgi:triphosphatase